MLWVKAFHVIFMVCWFAGLFYLPRLFVYHAQSTDSISIERFKIMERKLFFGITTPCGLLTILLGLWMLGANMQAYMQMPWMHLKLTFVLLLVLYHVYLGKLLFDFKHNRNTHGHTFYRIINEIPLIFLSVIVIAVIVKPFSG